MDAELGILLRCEEILDGRPLRVTELADLRIGPVPVGDNAPFRPPGGWAAVKESVPLDGSGQHAERTRPGGNQACGGPAAGGLAR